MHSHTHSHPQTHTHRVCSCLYKILCRSEKSRSCWPWWSCSVANGCSSVVLASQHVAWEREEAGKTLLTSALSWLAIRLCHFYRRREEGQGVSWAGWPQPQDNLWTITFNVHKGPAQERKVTRTKQEVLWLEIPHFMFASFANVFKLEKKNAPCKQLL